MAKSALWRRSLVGQGELMSGLPCRGETGVEQLSKMPIPLSVSLTTGNDLAGGTGGTPKNEDGVVTEAPSNLAVVALDVAACGYRSRSNEVVTDRTQAGEAASESRNVVMDQEPAVIPRALGVRPPPVASSQPRGDAASPRAWSIHTWRWYPLPARTRGETHSRTRRKRGKLKRSLQRQRDRSSLQLSASYGFFVTSC